MDYALVPQHPDDFEFFCADAAQQLLEAAGIRNDSHDYFKIPGNADDAWRRRLRLLLRDSLERVDSEEVRSRHVC